MSLEEKVKEILQARISDVLRNPRKYTSPWSLNELVKSLAKDKEGVLALLTDRVVVSQTKFQELQEVWEEFKQSNRTLLVHYCRPGPAWAYDEKMKLRLEQAVESLLSSSEVERR